MFQYLRGIALIAAMMLNCGAAFAEPDQASANFMMPSCRDVVSGFISKKPDFFTAGICTGIIVGVVFTGAVFNRICLPNGVIPKQEVAVVVQYIDERPARMHEDFKVLAIEALVAAWPCKK
jgi:hypothetical protein